jgi:hypothetical protein
MVFDYEILAVFSFFVMENAICAESIDVWKSFFVLLDTLRPQTYVA